MSDNLTDRLAEALSKARDYACCLNTCGLKPGPTKGCTCGHESWANLVDALLAEHAAAKAAGETAPDAFGIAHDVTKFLFDAGYVVQGADLKIVALETEKIIGKQLPATKAAGETQTTIDVPAVMQEIRDVVAADNVELRRQRDSTRADLDAALQVIADSGLTLHETVALPIQSSAKIIALEQELAAARADAGCGCRTAEQTGTSNGYSCNWHRERYVAGLAAARADADARVQAAVQERDKMWRDAVAAVWQTHWTMDSPYYDLILAEVERRTAAKPDADNRVTALAKERDREWQEAVDYI